MGVPAPIGLRRCEHYLHNGPNDRTVEVLYDIPILLARVSFVVQFFCICDA